MGTSNDLVKEIIGDDDEEGVDLEVADKLARNMIEGFNKRDVSPVNRVGACVLAAIITMLEDDADDHDIYATFVNLAGEMLREDPNVDG